MRPLHFRLGLFLGGALFVVSNSAAQDRPDIDWIAQVGSSGTEGGLGIAAGPGGDMYLAGLTEASVAGPNQGDIDAFVSRIDSDGNIVWTRQFGTPERDFVLVACPDGEGGVLAAGATSGNLGAPPVGSTDVFVARYDETGTQVWVRQFGSTDIDRPHGIMSDGQGGFFVSGVAQASLFGPSLGVQDAFVAHFDSAGSLVWGDQFGTTGIEEYVGLGTDDAGGVVTGGWSTPDASAAGANVFASRHDASGGHMWYREFDYDEPDYVRATTSDGQGGAYIGGSARGDFGGGAVRDFDALVVRVNSSGALMWARQLESIGNEVTALVRDPSGGVWVSGRTTKNVTSGTQDAFVARLDESGTTLWETQLFGSDSWIWPHAMERDDEGGAYIAWTEGADPHIFNARGAALLVRLGPAPIGEVYCSPAVSNSTGRPAELRTLGSEFVAENAVTLTASDVPAGRPVLFLVSREPGFRSHPGGSQGNLCLSTPIGRFLAGGALQIADASGGATLEIDLGGLPAGIMVGGGDTLYFQAWYRDSNPGPTSNFTDASSVLVR